MPRYLMESNPYVSCFCMPGGSRGVNGVGFFATSETISQHLTKFENVERGFTNEFSCLWMIRRRR